MITLGPDGRLRHSWERQTRFYAPCTAEEVPLGLEWLEDYSSSGGWIVSISYARDHDAQPDAQLRWKRVTYAPDDVRYLRLEDPRPKKRRGS